MRNTLISVIIPTYQRDICFLKRAVDSVLAQTYTCLEIIISDDNPEQSGISDVIREFCAMYDGKIKYIMNTMSHGASGARNAGVQAATGELIAFLDDDDEWLPGKLEMQARMFKDNVGMVFCKGFIVYSDETPQRTELYYNSRRFKSPVDFDDLIMRNYIGSTSQIMVKKELFETVGGFDETLVERNDYDLCIRFARVCDIVGVDMPLFIHYMHGNYQLTTDIAQSLQGNLKLYHKYCKDFRKNKSANKRICKSISKQYLARGRIFGWLLYMLKARFCL